jgi:hypothetical protein
MIESSSENRGFDWSRGFGTLISLAVGLITLLPAIWLPKYGYVMFLFLPFNMGLAAAIVDSWSERRSMWDCVIAATIPIVIFAALLLALGIEGLICIVMAVPVALPPAFLGAFAGFCFQRHRTGPAITAAMVILAPVSLLFGPGGPGHQMDTVTTSIVINAPAATVWKYVASFPELAPPRELLFRAGVAYPVATRIDGEGMGAARQCVLSTGVMTERVTAWEPGRLLRFEVLSTPPAMKELSPWPNLDPPHLHGFYVSKQGEFRLTPLPGERTLLEGQSWYRHGLEPVNYWNLWTGYIVHRIHIRILRHIKELSEARANAVTNADDHKQLRSEQRLHGPRNKGAGSVAHGKSAQDRSVTQYPNPHG